MGWRWVSGTFPQIDPPGMATGIHIKAAVNLDDGTLMSMELGDVFNIRIMEI